MKIAAPTPDLKIKVTNQQILSIGIAILVAGLRAVFSTAFATTFEAFNEKSLANR